MVAPLLATVNVAGAIYFWLHSRMFSCSNKICVSMVFLAEKLGVSRQSVTVAVKRLTDAGLIKTSSRRGYGGGSVFSLMNVTDSCHKCNESQTFKCKESLAANVTDTCHDIDKSINKNNKILSDSIESISEVISYLNEKTGRTYRPSTKSYTRLINARLCESYTVEDFKRVVDVKTSQWSGSDMERHLTPDTLFSQKHFDTYLNQPEPKNTKGSSNGDFSEYAKAF